MLRPSERKKIKEERIQRLTTEHSTYFTDYHNLKFVRRVGEGTGAIALLFQEIDSAASGHSDTDTDTNTDTASTAKPRIVVVKVAFSEYENRDKEADLELANERKWLKTLQGARHILRLLAAAYEVDASKVSRPAIVLEYVQGGDVKRFYRKAKAARKTVPNRVLWSMFLCLIRACVGLAYPPWKDGELETIPEDDESGNQQKQPSGIMHNDLHDENVLIGEMMPDCEEHQLAPMLKLIDFGKTMVMPPQGGETAEADNIYNAARVITGIAILSYNTLADVNMEVEIPVPVPGSAATAVRKMLVYTDPDLVNESESGGYYLHPDLKNLLLLCQTARNSDRPSLKYVLNICEQAVKNHTVEDYKDIQGYDAELESDVAVRGFIQRIVYDV